MKSPLLLRLLSALAALVLLPAAAEGAAPVARKHVVAYVPNWIDLRDFAGKIDYPRLTHINLAFENPVDDAGTLSFNPKNEAVLAKAREHGVKIFISIGGGSASDDEVMRPRYQRLMAAGERKGFAEKLAAYAADHQLDGLDIDIEGPSINEDYSPFIQELSTALKARGKLMTAALSKGYGGDRVSTEALACFDLVHIMAYDATGPWAPDRPGQHSSLPFATACIDYWSGRGLAAEKLVLGVPFYGYGFGTAADRQDYSYRRLLATFPEARNGDQAGETIWYNGPATIHAKGALAAQRKLGGVMIWSLNLDAEGKDALLPVLEAGVKGLPRPEN